MTCDECGAPIDKTTGFCIACGLESSDFKNRSFDKQVVSSSRERGAYESRERKARKVRQYGGHYGYTCALCYEMFQEVARANADHEMLRIESEMKGFEQPGTDIVRFNSNAERSEHIKIIHGGWREYYRKLKDRRRMAEIRRLEKLNRDTSVSTLRRDGEA